MRLTLLTPLVLIAPVVLFGVSGCVSVYSEKAPEPRTTVVSPPPPPGSVIVRP